MALPAPAKDRAAIVTGASSGIGEAMARELALRGHQLVLIARNADRLHALAADLDPDRAYVLPADLSRRTDRAALPDRIAALGLAPNVLINNAGVAVVAQVAKSVPEHNSTSSRSMSLPWSTSAVDSCQEWRSVAAAPC